LNKSEQKKYNLLMKWSWNSTCQWMNECHEPIKRWLHKYSLFLQGKTLELKYKESEIIKPEVVQFT
jgi:hypothetical protein